MEKTSVPLFLSRRRLAHRKTLPRARGRWALDSGGFSELTMYGKWLTPARQYVEEVRRFKEEVGRLDWAAAQDWMCEPFVMAKTGLTVAGHQRRTIENYLVLRDMAPELPWLPVLQGWVLDDYMRHLEDYINEGVDLPDLPIVGVGSVCRRQHTAEAEAIFRALSQEGIRMHGFGVKLRGARAAADVLWSADSMAWSYDARRRPPLPECSGHKNCANCLRFALKWRARFV